MWSSPLVWIVVAVVLFWALGAYNRLMRLRATVVQAFGRFDARTVHLIALLGEFDVALRGLRDRAVTDDGLSDPGPLQGATVQLSATLAVARASPLDAQAIAALAAARGVVHACWHSVTVQATNAHDPGVTTPVCSAPSTSIVESATSAAAGEGGGALADERCPGTAATLAGVRCASGVPTAFDALTLKAWLARWDEDAALSEQAAHAHDDAVRQYNAAILQFPASVLAGVFGFRAAQVIGPHKEGS